MGPDPEDFLVDEIPAYDPSGEGHHWFVHVRKRGIATPQMVRKMAQAAGCSDRDIGVAGRKDKHAVTTQWISMPTAPVAPEDDRIEILSSTPHGQKLRMGHLRGNRFKIRLVDLAEGAEANLPALLERLADGFPNYFGPQRFGSGHALEQGLALIANPKQRVRDPRFLASVVQSAVFNQWLGARVADGLLHTALVGDVLKKRETGGMFNCEDAADAERVASGEVDPTGPMPGPKMRAAEGAAGEREAAAFAEFDLNDEARIKTLGKFAPGTRRVARVVPTDVSHAWDVGGVVGGEEGGDERALVLCFTLPKGCFATTVLAELTHTADGSAKDGAQDGAQDVAKDPAQDAAQDAAKDALLSE